MSSAPDDTPTPRAGVLTARAYAKINLGLEILGKRPDGYHELRTILQTIDFFDVLELRRGGAGVELTTNVAALAGEDNLVVRAARRLALWGGIREPSVRIHLDKRIPPGMGLGGGSADAAVALMALNLLWKLGARPRDLHALAGELGMDVPFFLYGGTALAVGRGDEVYPLPYSLDAPLVLVLPSFAISTRQAYARLRLTKGLPALTLQHFAWSRPSQRDTVGELVNHLEGAAGEHASAIEGFKRALIGLGATGSMMSGSGAAVFGIFPEASMAERAASALRNEGLDAIATRTIDGNTYREMWLSSGA